MFLSAHSDHYSFLFFFFNDTATTEIYTLSLHDALPIWLQRGPDDLPINARQIDHDQKRHDEPVHFGTCTGARSEEHTSELQSPDHLVCRLLLEKKKKKKQIEVIHQCRSHADQRRHSDPE